jgi:CheY-like chemotaxis protein
VPGPAEILLIEDSPADAELIMHALQEAGLAAPVRVLTDGEEALDYLFRRGRNAERPGEPPRLVLLDIKLPKVDGLEVLRQLKSEPATRPIPVVMLTSSKVERDVTAAYRLGANGYVQKPMEFDRLRDVVGQLGRYWLVVNEPVPLRTFQHDAG